MALGTVEGEDLRNGFLLVVVRLEGRRVLVPVLHLGLAESTLVRHTGAAAKASETRGLEGIHEVVLVVLRSRLAEREAEDGCTGRLAEEGDSSPEVVEDH